MEEEIEGDKTIPADIRTSDIIVEIANTISPFIDLTVDSPSRNISGWMPILDLQMKVEADQIIYKFYKKSVSNKLTMMERSAMPTQIKRNSLVQEGIRRLRNTKRDLPWSVKSEILSEYSFSLMLSGYSEKFRLDTIQAAVKGYERQCQEADTGGAPLHRPRSWNQSERRKKKLLTKTSWYRPHNAVGFYPSTPGGELAKEIQSIVTEETARLGFTVKVVETGGISIKDNLVKLDLTGCNFPNCRLCESGLKGGSHTRRGAVYTGRCTLCEENNQVAEYHGESGSSAYQRFLLHENAVAGEIDSNAFHKHLEIHHKEKKGDLSVFKVKVEKTFMKCLDRQVFEGTLINSTDSETISLNSKAEFHLPAVTRITTSREPGA